jgi:hypothetical protein
LYQNIPVGDNKDTTSKRNQNKDYAARLNNETRLQAYGTMHAGGSRRGLTRHPYTIGRLLRWLQHSIIDRPMFNQPFVTAQRQKACTATATSFARTIYGRCNHGEANHWT